MSCLLDKQVDVCELELFPALGLMLLKLLNAVHLSQLFFVFNLNSISIVIVLNRILHTAKTEEANTFKFESIIKQRFVIFTMLQGYATEVDGGLVITKLNLTDCQIVGR